MLTEKKPTAYSVDLDDTALAREEFTRLLGLVTGKIKPHHLPLYRLSDLPLIDRTLVDVPLSSLSEKVSYNVHARRRVIPDTKVGLERAKEYQIDIYGNTGRRNSILWAKMTRKTLKQGGIDHYFQDIFYTPEGIKTAVSKAVGIRDLLTQYDNVSHFDDDPRTAILLAKLFPQVSIYLIHYGTTGLLYSRREAEQYENLHRIASFAEVI